jgi:hypothetical protein
VVIQGGNDFRTLGVLIALRHSTACTRKRLWYEIDRSNLAAVTLIDQVVSAAFILPCRVSGSRVHLCVLPRTFFTSDNHIGYKGHPLGKVQEPASVRLYRGA